MCVQNEDLDAAADLGPIDTGEDDLELAYELFFGASPLSSLCPTPTDLRESAPDLMAANAILSQYTGKRSRPFSPEPDTSDLAYEVFYGSSPLSSLCPTPPEPCKTVDDFMPANAAPSQLTSRNTRSHCPKPNTAATSQKTGSSKSQRDKKKAKKQRRIRRQRARKENIDETRMPDRKAAEKNMDNVEVETTPYDVAGLPSASTGYIALPDKKGRVHTLEELKDRGFKVVRWDGRYVLAVFQQTNLFIFA